MVLGHPCYWIIQIVVVAVALLRDLCYKYYRKQYEPRLFHVVQEFENKVGSFHRVSVKRETPWLFPKQELKVFKPVLKQGVIDIHNSSSASNAGANGGSPGGGGDTELVDLSEVTFQTSFYAPRSSPGKRRQRISDIIDSDDI